MSSKKECKHLDIRTRNKKRTRFQCNDCGKWFSDKNLPNTYVGITNGKYPKVLLFDTETAPILAYVWDVWKQNISPVQIVHNWFLISWSAKWLNAPEMMSAVLTPKEAINQDDSRIVRLLWNLFDEADIIIAHNADGFDVPKMNTRFLVHQMGTPSPYEVIDTLKVARKKFDFTHNKLNFLAEELGIPHQKLETEFALWKRCLAGDKKSLSYMQEYNDMDVVVLEEVYHRLRPFIKPHPNFNLYTDTHGCSTCGNDIKNLIKKGKYATTVNKYDSYFCENCGSYSRTGASKKKVNLRSVAR